MRSPITPNALNDHDVIEAARALDTAPAAFLAARANVCLGRIFEDVFGGAYCEAYFELSREEKSAILRLASECPDVRYHPDWLLRELLKHGGSDALAVYARSHLVSTANRRALKMRPPHFFWRSRAARASWTHRLPTRPVTRPCIALGRRSGKSSFGPTEGTRSRERSGRDSKDRQDWLQSTFSTTSHTVNGKSKAMADHP
jgi:hypothetical protein